MIVVTHKLPWKKLQIFSKIHPYKTKTHNIGNTLNIQNLNTLNILTDFISAQGSYHKLCNMILKHTFHIL